MDIVNVIQILGVLVQAGVATEHEIAAALRAHAGELLTEDQLNAIIDGVTGDAARRQQVAQADLEQAKQDGGV